MVIFRMWQCGAAAVIAAMFVGMVVSSGSAQTPTPERQGSRSEGAGVQTAGPDSVEGRSDRGEDGGAGGRSFEAGSVRRAGEVDSESHEPSALASERPVHHSDFGDVVGGDGSEIRSGQDGSHAGGELRHAFRETNSLRWREGFGGGAGDRRRRAGYGYAGGSEVNKLGRGTKQSEQQIPLCASRPPLRGGEEKARDASLGMTG
jgi:hypothetical protein